MATVSAQLLRSLRRRHGPFAGRPPAFLAPALSDALVAAGFLVLLARQVSDSRGAPPLRELTSHWWIFELAAIWLVPGVYVLFKRRGPRAESLFVKAILPLLLGFTLAAGAHLESARLLGGGAVLLFFFNKCLSFHFSSTSHRAREAFMMRIVVGGVVWIVSVVVAAMVLLCIRELFGPPMLDRNGLAGGTLLLAAVFYFATLAVLEVVMAAHGGERTCLPEARSP